jgi:hypothetical protein
MSNADRPCAKHTTMPRFSCTDVLTGPAETTRRGKLFAFVAEL